MQAGTWNGFTISNSFGHAYFPFIEFPTAFPTGVVSLQVTAHPTGNAPARQVAVDQFTKTRFRALVHNQAGSVQVAFSWLAIGY